MVWTFLAKTLGKTALKQGAKTAGKAALKQGGKKFLKESTKKALKKTLKDTVKRKFRKTAGRAVDRAITGKSTKGGLFERGAGLYDDAKAEKERQGGRDFENKRDLKNIRNNTGSSINADRTRTRIARRKTKKKFWV